MIFDTHAHYDDDAFEEDREALLSSMQENGIGTIVNVCANADELHRTLALTKLYPFVYGAAGVHPEDARKVTPEILAKIRFMAREPKILAIGEIGLDYYWCKDPAERYRQSVVFRAQMDIAREMQLPFIIHSREASEDTLNIVKEYMADGMYGGVIHCFSGSVETAREYVKMGLYLGIGGVVTFANARKLKDVVAEIPLSHLVLETDSPYLAPKPYRGKRNSSLYLPYVVDTIAELKGISPEEVVTVTEANAKTLFRLP